MSIDLDALERIAEAGTLVTTGNGWIADSGGIVLDPDREGDVWDGTIVCEVPSTENLRRRWHLRDHIAAFDPPTALALIARVREFEAIVNDGGNQAAKYWTRLNEAEARAQKANLQILDEVRAKKGQIVTASFDDGLDHEFLCGLEDCQCPEHDGSPRPAGTYITVRLDEDVPVGFWRVRIEREAEK